MTNQRTGAPIGFSALLHSAFKRPTVALFWGLSCAPCERMKPLLQAECAKLGLRLEMFNAREEMIACRDYDIRQVPTILMVYPDETAKVILRGWENQKLDALLVAAAGGSIS